MRMRRVPIVSWMLLLAASSVVAACQVRSAPWLDTDTPATIGALQTANSLLATQVASFASPAPALLASSTPQQSLATSPFAGLVYASGGSLWRIESDGSRGRLLEHMGPLSPDGTQVLYEEDGDIWSADLVTGDHLNLTNSPGSREDIPTWWPARPDVILFQVIAEEEPVGEGVIYGWLGEVGTDGRSYAVLDSQHWCCDMPSPSPDGSLIVYGCGKTGWVYHRTQGVMPFDPAAFGLNAAAYERISAPAWSPDGVHLAWVVDETGGDPRTARIAVFDLNEHTMQFLYPPGIPTLLGWQPGMVWSPDGQWLAYFPVASGVGLPGFWVARADGQQPHHLGFFQTPVWSPDGHWLAYEDDNMRGDLLPVRLLEAGIWREGAVETLPGDASLIGWAPIPMAAVPESMPPTGWLTYMSEVGHFSIQYPRDLRLHENETPSVDGVWSEDPNAITLLASGEGSFALVVHYSPVAEGLSTESFARQRIGGCESDWYPGQTMLLDDKEAWIFEETLCGPWGGTAIFLVSGGTGYQIDVLSHSSYSSIQDAVTQILATFRTLDGE